MKKNKFLKYNVGAGMIVGLALGLVLSAHAQTYVAPTSTPPGGNVDAPVNVGTALQTKNGTLGVSGLVNAGTSDFLSHIGYQITGTPTIPLPSKLDLGTAAGEAVDFYDGGAGSRLGVGINNAELQFFFPSSNHLSFNTGGDLQGVGTNELMRLTGAGNLGIGTTTPANKLDVKGGINTNGESHFSDGTYVDPLPGVAVTEKLSSTGDVPDADGDGEGSFALAANGTSLFNSGGASYGGIETDGITFISPAPWPSGETPHIDYGTTTPAMNLQPLPEYQLNPHCGGSQTGTLTPYAWCAEGGAGSTSNTWWNDPAAPASGGNKGYRGKGLPAGGGVYSMSEYCDTTQTNDCSYIPHPVGFILAPNGASALPGSYPYQ